ncbi:hypothetical protein HII31_04812 [Pseudocercospora fuligena]|uniref:Uncharacterized protein n=1 Tax=Pseudocercospora fuligena TaxID=685502 RepID=A0A8H6RMX5_9PEZI|nr:hypothetical protein HII31_04812 [Pseudocercospora fuligena]
MASFNHEQYALDAASTTARFSTMTITTSNTQRNDSLQPDRNSVKQEVRPPLYGYPPERTHTQSNFTFPPPGFSTVPLFRHTLPPEPTHTQSSLTLPPPWLSAALLFKRTLRGCMITPGSTLDHCTLIDVNVDGCQLTKCTITSDTFVPKLWNCTLTDCTIMDTKIQNCSIQSTFGEELHDPTERYFDIAGELFRQGGATKLK